MQTSEWIAEVDRLREGDELLRRGYWHGYTAARGVAPMKGEFYLVRWEQPTVAVSHDDRDEVIRLAKAIESIL
jgi:hypothetical protein